MEKIRDFRQLKVWQVSHNLVLEVYRINRTFPAEERYGLSSQMRRAAVSVAANIAEGFRRRGKKDKANFYTNSLSSLDELKYYFILAKDLRYIKDDVLLINTAEEIGKMLSAIITKTLKEYR